jgi:hypothetical protein
LNVDLFLVIKYIFLNSEATGYAGENLKGSTDTARACSMGACLMLPDIRARTIPV